MRRRSPQVRTFEPTVFEDLGPRPVLIESEKQLRQICKERELKSVHLENTMNTSRTNPTSRIFVWDKVLQRVVEEVRQ